MENLSNIYFTSLTEVKVSKSKTHFSNISLSVVFLPKSWQALTALTGAYRDRSEYSPSQIWMRRVGMDQGINTEQWIVQVILFYMNALVFC